MIPLSDVSADPGFRRQRLGGFVFYVNSRFHRVPPDLTAMRGRDVARVDGGLRATGDLDGVEAVLRGCRNAHPESVNSMHADRLVGRPMEIDERNGVIVRLGQKHGITTPYNQMAVTLLQKTIQPEQRQTLQES